jgi:epoxyqueuosine reductase
MPGTIRIISVRMNYLPPNANILKTLQDSEKGYISRYALGKDYHKILRQRLKKLAEQIKTKLVDFNYRAFVDSAPVMEKAIAEKAGLGWIGKHTLLLNKDAGSWFFLGELYTNLPLIIDQPVTSHCGSCSACIDICPTKAIIAPYQLDARKCISYLTIESKKSIPMEFRAQIGNRIFGCDDCQYICPWNKFAKQTHEIAFLPRHQLDDIKLLDLFKWSEQEFLNKTEGSPLRRTGYEGWLRNIAVALGNAKFSPTIVDELIQKKEQVSELVAEHIDWALEHQKQKSTLYSSEE